MDLKVLLAADYANIERQGKINVMGVFDRISAADFPARHPEMVLVMKLSAGPAEYGGTRKLVVKLLDEDATQELVDWFRDIDVPPGSGGPVEINQFLKLRDLVFPVEGVYTFYVLVDDDEKGTLPITLARTD